MESGWSCEHMTLINELTQGMELAKQLKFHLNSTSSVETRELLLQRMLSSFEKALLILKWSGSVGEPQTAAAPTTGLPESSISVDGSPGSGEDFERCFKEQQDFIDVSKKRKVLPTWTEQVRICSENGLEGPNDDGYSWRKYGQKDILGANYPRSYYRCTYRSVQNCWATKQVQRSDDDPTIFEITYRGRHTCCNQGRRTAPEPQSPEKQEPKQIKHYVNHQQQQQQKQPHELLLNFQTNLRVNTRDLDNKEMATTFSFPSTFGCMNSENQNFPFPTLVHGDNVLENYSYSSSFVSPATSGSNFFSMSPCQMNRNRWVHNLQHSESDLTEIISATTSATNSPIVDLDFSIDPSLDLDSNFPFDTTPGFFN